MKNLQYIPLDFIIGDWIASAGIVNEEFNENHVYKWANDAADRLNVAEHFEEVIELLKIREYKAELREGFKSVIQAGYMVDKKECTRQDIVQWTQKALDGSGCELEINLKCPDCYESKCECDSPAIIVDVNKIYENANPDIYTRHMKHFHGAHTNNTKGSMSYHPNFRLMHAAMGSFHNTPYHIKGCPNLNFDCEVEYTIDMPYIKTNFKDGWVLISYLKERMGEDGNRLVPDTSIVVEAIIAYIEHKMAYIQYRKTKTNQDFKFYQVTTQNKEMIMRRAMNYLQTPSVDVWNRFWSKLNKVVPNKQYQQNIGKHRPDDFDLNWPRI